MRVRTWAVLGAVLLVALCVVAVVQFRDGHPSSSSVASSPASIAPETVPPGAVDEDTGQVVTVAPVPVWDSASRDAALAAGTTVMDAFARPVKLDERQWWEALEPLLTPRAQPDYATVDPRNVPVTKLTGKAELVEEGSAYVARVKVSTNAGAYVVVLSRRDAAAPWLADDLVPPGRQR